MSEEVINQQPHPTVGHKSKLVKKFKERFPQLDHFFEDGRFRDPKTQEVFEIFKAGWYSHPLPPDNYVSVIGQLTDQGTIKFADQPRIHVNPLRAYHEMTRLSQKHPGTKFIVFSSRLRVKNGPQLPADYVGAHNEYVQLLRQGANKQYKESYENHLKRKADSPMQTEQQMDDKSGEV